MRVYTGYTNLIKELWIYEKEKMGDIYFGGIEEDNDRYTTWSTANVSIYWTIIEL